MPTARKEAPVSHLGKTAIDERIHRFWPDADLAAGWRARCHRPDRWCSLGMVDSALVPAASGVPRATDWQFDGLPYGRVCLGAATTRPGHPVGRRRLSPSRCACGPEMSKGLSEWDVRVSQWVARELLWRGTGFARCPRPPVQPARRLSFQTQSKSGPPMNSATDVMRILRPNTSGTSSTPPVCRNLGCRSSA